MSIVSRTASFSCFMLCLLVMSTSGWASTPTGDPVKDTWSWFNDAAGAYQRFPSRSAATNALLGYSAQTAPLVLQSTSTTSNTFVDNYKAPPVVFSPVAGSNIRYYPWTFGTGCYDSLDEAKAVSEQSITTLYQLNASCNAVTLNALDTASESVLGYDTENCFGSSQKDVLRVFVEEDSATYLEPNTTPACTTPYTIYGGTAAHILFYGAEHISCPSGYDISASAGECIDTINNWPPYVEGVYVGCGPGRSIDPFTHVCGTDLVNIGRACPAKGVPIVGDPINLYNGNSYESVTDYQDMWPGRLRVQRAYNSMRNLSSHFGENWISNYQKSLNIVSGTQIWVPMNDGRMLPFTYSSSTGLWTSLPNVFEKFVQTADGYMFTRRDDVQELYNSAGNLVSINYLDGYTQTLNYDANGLLDSVVDSLGRSLFYSYNTNGLISSITDPAGGVYTYGYDSAFNLISVTYPDHTTTQYTYTDPAHPNALTSIIDRNGNVSQTWGYDADGRAIGNSGANGVNSVSVTYKSVNVLNGVDSTNRLNGVPVSVMDSLGRETDYQFKPPFGYPQITTITGPGCAACSDGNAIYLFGSTGGTLSQITQDGTIKNFATDSRTGNTDYYSVGSTAAPNLSLVASVYTYSPNFLDKVATKQERGVCGSGYPITTTYTRDSFGNPTQVQVTGYQIPGYNKSCVTAPTRTTTYQYNGPLHQVTQIDGPRTDISDITSYSYYPLDPSQGNNSGRLQRVILANGIIARDNIQYDATGKILSEVRPNGLTIGYTYYSGNDRLQSVTLSDGTTVRITRWTYLATGEVKTITVGDGTPQATTLTFGYDDARRLISVTDGLGNPLHYTLDSEGNRTAETVVDSNGNLQRSLNQTFDIYNHLASTSQANESHLYTVAANGTLTGDTDGNLTNNIYTYDALKRELTSTQDIGDSNSSTANALTKYSYDSQSNLTTVISPNNSTTQYTYDDFGDELSQTSPDSGSTTMTYDLAGNMVTRTDAKGQTFAYSYDALNRVVQITAPNTADSVTYSYDTCTNGVGRLCSITRNGQVTTYSYDAFGDITASQNVGYTYDAIGRVQTITYPSGDSVTYHYDAAGQVSGVDASVNGVNQSLASNITYAPFGPVTSMTYGNGAVLTQTLDTAYRLVSQTVPGIYQRNYTQYDGNGNLTSFADAITNTTTSYGYDALNRLTDASGDFGTQTIGYDLNGNRVNLVDNTVTTSYAYNANSNRLNSVDTTAVVTDANGNITSNGIHAFTFNTLNQLVGVDSTMSYGYNGLGQRTVKQDASDLYTYVYSTRGQLLAESDNGNLSAEYVYLNGVPLAVIQQGNVYYIHTDNLGTPRAVSDANKKVVWSWGSDPFGKIGPNSDPDGDGVSFTLNLRFPGQYYDAESGLYYNYFRYYDPSTGRYITSDPIGLRGGLNTYGYVGGNPIKFVDPLGLDPGYLISPQYDAQMAQSINAPPKACRYCNKGDLIKVEVKSAYCRTGDVQCGKAMAAAGFQPPYYPVTGYFSKGCLIDHGLLGIGGDIVQSNVIEKGAPWAATNLGASPATAATVGEVASKLTGPELTVIQLPYALGNLSKECKCPNAK